MKRTNQSINPNIYQHLRELRLIVQLQQKTQKNLQKKKKIEKFKNLTCFALGRSTHEHGRTVNLCKAFIHFGNIGINQTGPCVLNLLFKIPTQTFT